MGTVHAGDNGRFHESPVSVQGVSAQHDGTAFGKTGFQFLKHFCSVAFMNQTAHANALFHAGPNGPLAHFSTHGFDEVVVNVLVHKETGTGPAHLSGVHEDAKADGLCSVAKVGIGKDDVGALSTEFKRDGRQLLTGLGHHGLSGWHTARQHNTVNTGVAGQGVSGESTGTGQDLQNTGRKARFGLVNGFAPCNQGKRSPRSRFGDDRAPGSEGGGNGTQGQLEWEVPRNDVGRYAQRLA